MAQFKPSLNLARTRFKKITNSVKTEFCVCLPIYAKVSQDLIYVDIDNACTAGINSGGAKTISNAIGSIGDAKVFFAEQAGNTDWFSDETRVSQEIGTILYM
ncbi:Molybdopterin biosynthesis protein MoeA [uncultured Candidatus Thioglobus sp.]|nr:Molybdopterin biosynthesis protein MoeA [uncultured Candidatus Thioglobus sp.]